jgi:putative membrane protein
VLAGGRWLIALATLLIWVGLIALAIYGVRHFRHAGTSDTALSILDERFARGEIDRDEYEQRKAALLQRLGSRQDRVIR